MAAKFNKEMLLKHRFWIMISVAIVLLLVGIFYLGLIVQADTTKHQGIAKQGHGYKASANLKTVEVANEHAETAKKSESGIHESAYRVQQPIFRWSETVESEFNFQKGYFANEIKIDKAPADVKEWPTDAPNAISGVLIEWAPDWFKLRDKDKKEVKFHRTDNLEGTITVVGEEAKINYPKMSAYKNKKDHLVTVTYQAGKYFNDPLTVQEQRAFANSYRDQVMEVLKMVDPLDEKHQGVVQLKDWLFNGKTLPDVAAGGGGNPPPNPGAGGPAGGAGKFGFIRYVTEVWGGGIGKDFSEEAWIAQENIWVQRELYRIIREANDSISKFKGKPIEKTGVMGTFKNSSFEANLTLDAKNKLVFNIKNLLPRSQKLDLLFRVKMNKSLDAELIPISGPMLTPANSPGSSFQQEVAEKPESPRKGIYSLDQVLTWETAAVKRIDYISIGSADPSEYAHGHRTFDKLRPFDEKAIAKPEENVGGELPGGGGGGKFPGVGPGMGAAGGANQKMLDHGLWTFRYSEVTEQSRRIPVAVVLIVDQNHVDRILTAFNNSKLRFLQQQVLLNHYTGSLQPPPIEEKKDGAGGGFPGEGKGGGGVPFIPGRGPGGPGPGMGGPGMPGGGNPMPGGGGPDMDTNMELVVYGTMTLYQRYPTRPPVAEKK